MVPISCGAGYVYLCFLWGFKLVANMELSEVNVSCIDCGSQGPNQSSLPAQNPSAGMTTALASVLIFTIVVDILGNMLVILSVFRNKKLRNADLKVLTDFQDLI